MIKAVNVTAWKQVQLETCIEKIVGGGTPSKEVESYWGNDYPWVSVKDLKGNILEETEDYISEEGLKNSAANVVPAMTLIIATRMALGKAVFFEKDVTINQDLKALYPNEQLSKWYLFHWFQFKSDLILSLGSGSTVKGIRLEVLKTLKIDLPPLPEQQKIAEILSTVDDKIDIIDQQIAETQELKKGLMQRLLTKGIGHTEFKDSPLGEIPKSWKTLTIKEICTVVRGASPRPKGDPRFYGGNVPRLMGADVTRDGKYVYPKIDFLTDEGAKKSRFMPAGTLVMICSGDVGVPSILAIDACVHDGFLAFSELSQECDIDFLYYIFESLKDKFHSSATHGGIFTNLTTSIIKDFKIPVPVLEEQNVISRILNISDEKISCLRNKKLAHQELKKGLMQKLLTGQIRVHTNETITA